MREVIAARLEEADMAEDEAASRIAKSCAGRDIRVGAAFTGRANLYATEAGLALVDAAKVDALNAMDESITLATLAPFTRVAPRQMLATIKIIPFAAPRARVEDAERVGTVVRVAPFLPRPRGADLHCPSRHQARLLDKNRAALEERLKSIGSAIVLERRVAHETEALAAAIREAKGADPILIFGASAITDRRDVVPAAIAAAGGTIDAFGMPVDPGNLLLTARLGGVTVVGPSRLRPLAQAERVRLRPLAHRRRAAGWPRRDRRDGRRRPPDRDPDPAPATRRAPGRAAQDRGRGPGRGAVVTDGVAQAAGGDRRQADGAPRRGSRARQCGCAGRCCHRQQGAGGPRGSGGLKVWFVDNPDFSKGLSSSLKRGISALPDDCDGVLVLLADMPDVSAVLIDKLIAAFDPAAERAICVATRHGRRGNPVLWARRFFPEIDALEGDVGAKALMVAYDDLVCEVEAADDAPLVDIDTPEALEAYRAR